LPPIKRTKNKFIKIIVLEYSKVVKVKYMIKRINTYKSTILRKKYE
tara:strand:+ start:2153 stop:2290 length:138 start_codon:yes stop_codon:yes gene_type:complete